MKPFYISTTIPYVNAEPHMGFGLELVQADAHARYQRLKGREVYFLSGTDENSLKNVRAAKDAEVTTKELVDKNAEKFQELLSVLNAPTNDFIRTTEERHILGSQKFWRLCEKDIYKKTYAGLYCVGCELFYKESELINSLCPEHHTKPELVEEENYFFRLSAYGAQLKALYENDEIRIFPARRKNEVLSFINSGLEDFSISRSVARAHGWGIPVPRDKDQIMYVWFDALTNYINALGFASDEDNFKKFWENKDSEVMHAMGKGVIRFHAVYWPAMLLSAGLRLPDKLLVHGYITAEGEKMSKSLGNALEPKTVVDEWGVDPLRYFLLREITPFEDGDFSSNRLLERYNADLAHGLGNLVSRSLTLMAKNEGTQIDADELSSSIADAWAAYHDAMNSLRFHTALEAIWRLIGESDKYINDKKPWELAEDSADRAAILSSLWIALANISNMLAPILPETSEKITDMLDSEDSSSWKGKRVAIVRPEPLFATREHLE